MIRISFQGIQHRRVCPNTEGLSPSRFAVNHVPGLICKASPQYTQALPPARVKGSPQSSALRLCRPPLRSALSTPAIAPFQGWEIPLPLTLAILAISEGSCINMLIRLRWKLETSPRFMSGAINSMDECRACSFHSCGQGRNYRDVTGHHSPRC